MVRNPRMVMMCGLLAVAMAVSLGSRPVVASGDEASAMTLLGALVPGAALWAGLGMEALSTPSPAPVAMAPPAPQTVAFDPGARQPRQSRQPRDAFVREAR